MEYGVSVCISAYKSQDYIEECLDSVKNQIWFKNHDNWEILVGIDGCETTLKKVKEIMHKYKNLRVFMMDSNKGTYVTCNTIMKLAKYEWLYRFDSDDIMTPNCISSVMSVCDDYDMVTGDMINFGISTKITNRVKKLKGHHLIRASVFFGLNGYDNYRLSMDTDLVNKMRKFYRFKHIDVVLTKRRQHENSLTCSKETRTNVLGKPVSEERLKVYKIVKNPLRYLTKEGIRNKSFVTNTYREIK